MDNSLYFWKESNVKRACEAKLTPLSVDFDAKTGIFPSSRGSSSYTCSLDFCSCVDFSIRGISNRKSRCTFSVHRLGAILVFLLSFRHLL